MKNLKTVKLIKYLFFLGLVLILSMSIPKTVTAQVKSADEVLNGLEQMNFKQSSVSIQENELLVSTGIVEGRWTWTGKGFVSTGFKNLQTDKEWVSKQPEHLADWDLSLFDDDVELVSLTADISNDDNFTSQHIRIIAEMDYAMSGKHYGESGIRLRFEIWAYPDAPGFRTQLFLKGIK